MTAYATIERPATTDAGTVAPAPVARLEAARASFVLGVVLAVVLADQALKGWAWRTQPDVHLNTGGNEFVGWSRLGSLLSDRVYGAGLDVVNAVLLLVAGVLIARWSRSKPMLFGGALAVAGWTSNIADRLGLHFATAPGSARGVVDYFPFAGHYWNLADVMIGTGTAVFLVSLAAAGLRPPRPVSVRPPRPRLRQRTRRLMITGVATLCVLAIAGATLVGTAVEPATTYALGR